MTSRSDNFLANLQSEHCAAIDFPLSRAELGLAADAFLDFLALPESVKRQLHFPARSTRASADGYTDKSMVDAKDAKQFFHWSPPLMNKATCQSLQQSYPEIDTFFSAAERIYQAVEVALLQVFTDHLTQYRTRVMDNGKLVDGILRFLCYTPGPEQSTGARAHFDKGFSTLALADSAPGLRIGCCDHHPLKAVHYQDGSALFMPAWMLFQASGGEISPAWHDVVQMPAHQNVNAQCARWSIVFFVNDPQAEFCSWDTVHTPLH